jgi:copper chaperone CopZ
MQPYGSGRIELQIRLTLVAVIGLIICSHVDRPAYAQAAQPRAAQSVAPARTYQLLGSPSDADLKRVREALTSVEGVTQVEVVRRALGILVRVRGDARQPELANAALSLGYDLMPLAPRLYVATGPTGDADVAKLRAALSMVDPDLQVQIQARAGGASVRIRGEATGEALAAAAKSAGYELRRESAFVASGPTAPRDYARLREALAKLSDAKYQLQEVAGGAMLTVNGEVEDSEIAAAAKSAGYGLRSITGKGAAGDAGDTESITAPAPGERNIDDITKVGEPAPDFSLVTKDGKGKIALSDYRGKKPVVLIFGSYT